MARFRTIVAVCLIVVGALAIAGPTFGFSSISADRGVNIAIADTSSALLGIEETGEVPDNQNDAIVVVIHNNAATDFDKLVTDVVLDTNRLAISDDFNDSVAQGKTTGLELTCQRGGSGEATVTVAADAYGSGLSIEGIDFSHTFSYSCTGGGSGSGGGFQSVSAGNVEGTSPTTQTFSFTMDGKLSQKDTVTLDISAQNVSYRSAAVIEVDGGHKKDEAEIVNRSENSATIEFTPHNNLNSGDKVTITIDGVELTGGSGRGTVKFTESATDQTETDSFSSSTLPRFQPL